MIIVEIDHALLDQGAQGELTTWRAIYIRLPATKRAI